ncbi:MAG: NAD(P)/FAD-dependent oxidoreductase [Pseudomonadota bacterium]
MEQVEAVVVGAGVVGLAVARALARAGREVIVLEAEEAFGTVTSSRNSEVIHAGIYYAAGSLKARLCVEGKLRLYDYCAQHGVGHDRCGKLIVATEESELPMLDDLKRRAAVNGVDDLIHLSPAEVAEREPVVHCLGALLSPSTGIIDSHGLMLAYLGDAEDAGAMLALNAPVTGGEAGDDGIVLNVGGAAPMTLRARLLVNAAGLGANDLAGAIDGMPVDKVPALYLVKGSYYTLSGRSPFGRLIYPAPNQVSLGVHVTIDLGGQCRFGPDAEWVQTINYDVDPARADVFYDAVRRFWPDLQNGALEPGYSGIRPKVQAPGEPAADFVIQGPADHGVPGLVNLFGIESPGLTSSLALADEVLRGLGVNAKS